MTRLFFFCLIKEKHYNINDATYLYTIYKKNRRKSFFFFNFDNTNIYTQAYNYIVYYNLFNAVYKRKKLCNTHKIVVNVKPKPELQQKQNKK